MNGPGLFNLTTPAELLLDHQRLTFFVLVAVHVDAIYHCGLTKTELRNFVMKENLEKRIFVPDEGDILSLN